MTVQDQYYVYQRGDTIFLGRVEDDGWMLLARWDPVEQDFYTDDERGKFLLVWPDQRFVALSDDFRGAADVAAHATAALIVVWPDQSVTYHEGA